MGAHSSQQADRILALLHALLQSEQGLTREQIYQQVGAYQQAPTDVARRRVFEHDMRHLKLSPFSVEIDLKIPTTYKISKGQEQ